MDWAELDAARSIPRRRIGHFSIREDVIANDAEHAMVRAIMAEVIVLEACYDAAANRFVYTAMSEHFLCVPVPNDLSWNPPAYSPLVRYYRDAKGRQIPRSVEFRLLTAPENPAF